MQLFFFFFILVLEEKMKPLLDLDLKEVVGEWYLSLGIGV